MGIVLPVRVDLAKDNEKILARVYEKLYNQIISNPAYPFDIITLKRLFNDKVYTATRKAVEETYKEGIRYIGKKLKTDTYVTSTDLDNIKKQTDKAVNQFWGRIQNDMDRANEQTTAEFIGTEPKDDLSTLAVLQAIPTIAMFSSLAISSISKARQIKPQITPIPTPQYPTIAVTEGGGVSNLEYINLGILGVNNGTPPSPDVENEDSGKIKFEWVTAGDEKVCPICDELDGQIFDSDDPDLRIPGENGPGGTHSNCRCYVSLVTN